MCFLFIYFFFIWYILYSWVGELKRRKKATAVLYNKQDGATRDQLSSFLALYFAFAFAFLFLCIFLVFFSSFSISIPTSHQLRFMIVMSHLFVFVQSSFSSLFPSPQSFFFFSFFSVNFCGKKKAFAMVLIP